MANMEKQNVKHLHVFWKSHFFIILSFLEMSVLSSLFDARVYHGCPSVVNWLLGVLNVKSDLTQSCINEQDADLWSPLERCPPPAVGGALLSALVDYGLQWAMWTSPAPGGQSLTDAVAQTGSSYILLWCWSQILQWLEPVLIWTRTCLISFYAIPNMKYLNHITNGTEIVIKWNRHLHICWQTCI